MPQPLPVKVKPLKISSGPTINVIYPEIAGLQDAEAYHFINHKIITATQELIDQQTDDNPGTLAEMDGSFEIKNNQRDVLSLSLSNYAYHHQAAHGMTYISSLTFDLRERKLCRLQDLFKSGSDYVERLSSLIRRQIQQRDIQLLHDFTEIEPNQDFYIADKTLVIYFQLYDITPYVFGFPMFPISVYDLEDIIDDSGPLGRMAVNN